MKWLECFFLAGVCSVLLATGCSSESPADSVAKPLGPRLYSTGFQSDHVQVFNSRTGGLLKEISADAESIGLAVSPDGNILYIADSPGPRNGRLRIFNTSTWKILKTYPIKNLAHLLHGNPISISGDGRWLLIQTHISESGSPVRFSQTLFDTEKEVFRPPPAPLAGCSAGFQPPALLGETGHDRLYAACQDGRIIALDSNTLKEQWASPAPTTTWPRLVLSKDKKKLYSFHAIIDQTKRDTAKTLATELQLTAWSAADGRLLKKELLSRRAAVPLATVGRGDAGYLAISPDGKSLFVLWEDRLWTLGSADLSILREHKLPAPADGLVADPDGGHLYIMPSGSGDLKKRGHGLWSLDLESSKLDTSNDKWSELSGISSFFVLGSPGREN